MEAEQSFTINRVMRARYAIAAAIGIYLLEGFGQGRQGVLRESGEIAQGAEYVFANNTGNIVESTVVGGIVAAGDYLDRPNSSKKHAFAIASLSVAFLNAITESRLGTPFIQIIHESSTPDVMDAVVGTAVGSAYAGFVLSQCHEEFVPTTHADFTS